MSRKRLVRFAYIATVALGILVALMGLVLWSATRPPEFYVAAQIADPATLNQQADEFLRRWSSMANMMQSRQEPVAIELPGEEINAWIQRDVQHRLREVLPVSLRDPRIALSEDSFQLGFTTTIAGTECVVTVKGKAWLPSPNLLAIQLQGCSIGKVPAPRRLVASMVRHALEASGVAAELREHQGDPTLLITLPETEHDGVRLLDLRIYQGRLYLSAARTAKEQPPEAAHSRALSDRNSNAHSSSPVFVR